MDRAEILHNIVDSSELSILRALIKNSKTLQQKAFKGWRPQALTKEKIAQRLLRTVYVNDDEIFEMLCDWWKNIHKELIDGLCKATEGGWESIISRWPVSKVRLAIFLGEFDDKETLNAGFMEAAVREFVKVQNQTAVAADAVKQVNAKEYSKLKLKIEKVEKRLSEALKKSQTLSKLNQSYSESNKKLQSKLAIERNRLELVAKSNKELAEKIKSLEKTNRTLDRQVKLLKKGASARLKELKVVFIDYLDLGKNPDERKSALSLLNDLLCSKEGMVIDVGNRSSKWLDVENVKLFWKKEGNKVAILNCPEDYVILNMGTLMEDFLYDQGCHNGRIKK